MFIQMVIFVSLKITQLAIAHEQSDLVRSLFREFKAVKDGFHVQSFIVSIYNTLFMCQYR
jgi:hypothetical protein